MIVYTLNCAEGHEFEGWFRDRAAFDEQARAGHVACPVCGGTAITRGLSAPRLNRGEDGAIRPAALPAPAAAQGGAPRTSAAMAPATPGASGADTDRAALARIAEHLQKIRRHVESTFENVGDRFAEEARAIHHGEAEERGIYGDATREEVQELMEEGIAVAPLPGTGRKGH
jgi:hypothetical protein